MKRLFVLVCALGLWAAAWAAPEVNIVPKPLNVETGDGSFTVDAATVVTVGRDASLRSVGELFAAMIEPVTGRAVKVKTAADGAKIALAVDPELGEEEYVLRVTPAGADVRGGSPKGVLYGLQSLRQLVIEGEGTVPAVTVKDKPYFGYRGAMLDVCRHFMPVEDVKAFIDILAMHKLNRFHFHLTDDQGWRIEIKRYPRLTEIGGYRTRTQIGGFHEDPITYEQGRYGGYYTQDEIREVVAYAAERHIAVIPEIEMPGHATAALAAYPELACGHGPKSFETSGRWGVLDDVFCPGKEQTFEFLEGVLDEVLDLFPSKLIHIGGDECPRVSWKECPDCRARMEDEGIEDEAGLQTYLTLRIGRHLEAKGRRLIGWDEILDGELAPGAVVMSWRGTRGGIAAARRRHEVIMTPSTSLSFDTKATDSYDEPVSLSSSLLPLEKIYGYDPDEGIAPEDRRYLLGVQANLWTEFIRTEGRASFQLLPRIYALAEIAWSPVERKSWREFSEVRLPAHLARIDASGEPYRLPAPLGIEDGTSEGESFSFVIRPPFPGCKVRYTLNGAVPQDFDREMPEKFDIAVPRGEQRTLRCVTIAPSGRRSTVTTVVLTNRTQTNNPE